MMENEFNIDECTAKVIKKYPQRAKDIVQSFDEKQIKSKEWLYNELSVLPIPEPRRIYVAGSWYGNILVPYLLDLFPNIPIKLHDLDEEVTKISRNFYFKDNEFVKTEAIDSTEFLYHRFLVNTSCEHMQPLKCKPNTYVVLQSNNYTEIEDHINCVDSPEQLAEQYNVDKIYYKGSLDFEKYQRFMVIGITTQGNRLNEG